MPRRNFDPELDVQEGRSADLTRETVAVAKAEMLPTTPASPGTTTPESAVCAGGHSNPAGAKFCSECGSRLDGEADPAVVATRERQHQEALALGKANPPVQYQQPRTKDTILIHFLVDGFYAFGNVWMRGQELELDKSGNRWEEEGRYWMELDTYGQQERYGKVCFAPGPWPGKQSYTEAAGSYQRLKPLSEGGAPVAGPTPEQLAQADAAERRRGRGVPAPTMR